MNDNENKANTLTLKSIVTHLNKSLVINNIKKLNYNYFISFRAFQISTSLLCTSMYFKYAYMLLYSNVQWNN